VVDRFIVNEIHRTALGPSPLELLAAAAVKGAALAVEADAVVDHFVAEARRAGCSWTEIGESLGVSKQAVRERFVDRVDVAGRERFTPRLQRCVAAARDLAGRHDNAHVGPGHLLLAFASNEGVAGVVLDRLGVTPDRLRAHLGPLLGDDRPGAGVPTESLDFIGTLRSASLFALERGHDYVGTEHALFVLATDPGARTRRVLELVGVDVADIKRELASCLCNEPSRRRRRRHGDRRCSFCATRDPAPLMRGPGVAICAICARVAEGVTAT
jgi:ATP-dependent Clp protease ATP-binding subunit ClpA